MPGHNVFQELEAAAVSQPSYSPDLSSCTGTWQFGGRIIAAQFQQGGGVIPLGYGSGSGGTVTQSSAGSGLLNGVTLNKPSGQITTATLTGGANLIIPFGNEVQFTVTNSFVSSADVILPSVQTQFTTVNSQVQAYVISVASGSFVLGLTNVGTADAVAGAAVINFAVINVATS